MPYQPYVPTLLRWADKQRQDAQAQLDISLSGRTEQWKARLWARKLEQLKVRNDALADSLDLTRRRIKKLEDQKEDAVLKAGHVQVGAEAVMNQLCCCKIV